MEIKAGIHNEWKIVVRDAKTGKIKRVEKGHNILLNGWWTRYLSTNNNTCLNYIHFGSGADTPVQTNTKLKTPLGSKSAANTVTDTNKWKSDGVIKVEKSCRLEANEYVGATISEVGFSYQAATTAGLLTHSLINDANGNPLSITKNADEVVDIFGTVFFKIGWKYDNDKSGFMSMSSLKDQLICKWAFAVTSSGNTIMFLPMQNIPPCETDNPSNPFGGVTGGVAMPTPSQTFNSGDKTYKISFADTAIAAGNVLGGIASMAVNEFFIKIPCEGFSQPVIKKEVVGTGDGVTKDFQTKFGFVKDNGILKVYVNDIEVSASADFGRGYPVTDISPYLKYIGETKKFIPAKASGDVIFDAYPYNEFGIESVNVAYAKIYTSDDGESWTQAEQRFGNRTDVSIPVNHKNKRFWKIEPTSNNVYEANNVKSTAFANSKNVHLASAPAAGDTVAVTYQPDCIAKDDKHTLKNISITFSFNEYTP